MTNYFANEKKFIEIDNFNQIIFSLSNLNNQNNIELPLEIFYTVNKIPIKILNGKESYEFKLNTEFNSQNIKFKNKTYKFNILDKKHDKYIRINSYDLLTNVEIGIDDYFDGFLFIFDSFKKNISRSINLHKNMSMIIKFQNEGLPIWSQKNFGDLYINFYINKKIKRIHKNPISKYFKYSDKIENIMNNINIYD